MSASLPLPGIYRGWVRHRRRAEHRHEFRYPLAMVLFDLEDLAAVFARSPWWSLERFNLISFKRKDYLAGQVRTDSLVSAVKQRIWIETGKVFDGQIQLLTHPRYLGFVINPVSFYLCSVKGVLQFIVAEINNTPWDERHSYVLAVEDAEQSRVHVDQQSYEFGFDKNFHVSPFLPMDLYYQWRFIFSPGALSIHMNVLRRDQSGRLGAKVFDATMQGCGQAFTPRAMARLPVQYPLQTALVALRIYWHALLLWLKGVTFFTHPKKISVESKSSGESS